MEEVVREIKELRHKREEEDDSFKNKIKFENVRKELEYNIKRGRSKPSNIMNHKKYGSTFYNWVLYYFGY